MDHWSTAGIVVAAVVVAAMVIGAVVLLVKVVRLRAVLRRADVPRAGKVAFWGSILYLVCPVDLLPDPVLLDDIGVLLLALRYLSNVARKAEAEAVDGPVVSGTAKRLRAMARHDSRPDG
jgi:uncharacterized membrane protein YkvA (DUF1232 family)